MLDDYGFEIYEENDFPIAYLVTFRTFGTWLHTVARGFGTLILVGIWFAPVSVSPLLTRGLGHFGQAGKFSSCKHVAPPTLRMEPTDRSLKPQRGGVFVEIGIQPKRSPEPATAGDRLPGEDHRIRIEYRLELSESIGSMGKQIVKQILLSTVGAILLSTTIGFAQQNKTITTTTSDPASVTLAALLAQADVVAFVEIRSGDAENYDVAVYKSRVLKAYKGTKENAVIYFAPFISYGLGSEYLVFLKKTGERLQSLVPKKNKKRLLPYDSKQGFYRIMYEGYGVLPVSFECVFGKPAHENCGYAVKFNTKQVQLPTRLQVFPQMDDESDVRYVKRGEIENLLELLRRGN